MTGSNISRRDFLKGAAAGTAGLMASSLIGGIAAGAETGENTEVKAEDRRKDAALVERDSLPTVAGTGKLRYRWNGCVFNEIVLPNGKVIVVDPYWYGIDNQYIADNTVKAGKWVCGADYMILTHTHGDHVNDVPSILDWYPMCRTVVPKGGAAEFCATYNINPMSKPIYAVEDGAHLEFPDFALDVIPSRHTLVVNTAPIDDNKRAYYENERNKDTTGSMDDTKVLHGVWGALHFCNYLITTKDGFKILIYGGTVMYDPYLYKMVGMEPDMMFYQAAQCNLGNFFVYTSRNIDLTPETLQTDELANFVASVGAGLCMPSHQEKFSLEMLDLIGERCAKVGAEQGTKTQYFVPMNNTWYVMDKDNDGNMTVALAADIPEKKADPEGLSEVNDVKA